MLGALKKGLMKAMGKSKGVLSGAKETVDNYRSSAKLGKETKDKLTKKVWSSPGTKMQTSYSPTEPGEKAQELLGRVKKATSTGKK